MIGGVSLFRPGTERPIQIWDSATDQERSAGIKGGETLAFAFRPDRTSSSAHSSEPGTLDRATVGRGQEQLLCSLQLPLEGKSKIQALARNDGWIVDRGFRD